MNTLSPKSKPRGAGSRPRQPTERVLRTRIGQSPSTTLVFDDFKESIGWLSDKELQALDDLIAFARHRKRSSSGPHNLEHDQEFVFDLVQRYLHDMTRLRPMPISVAKKLPSFKRVETATVHLDHFAQSVEDTGCELNQMRRLALYRLCIEQWGRRCTELNIPLSLTAMCNQAEHTAGLFDHAYPGYLASSTVHWVLDRIAGARVMTRRHVK